jgi:hypothetical protein
MVARWRVALEAEGYVLHAAAEAVLLEYGGLRVGSVGPGREVARSDVWLDPSVAAGERERFEDWLPELRGRTVVPVGEAHHSHGFVGVTPDGEVYLVMDGVYGRWPSFQAALQALLLGLQPADA